jgi:hypothetical protein
MLKTLFPAVFLWVCTCVVASPQEISIMGSVIPLEKPLDVAVTVIQRAQHNLVYWAQPLETDTAGKADVKAFVEKTRTNNAMINPFAFQFRLAGIESAVMEGTDLTNDDFKQEVDEAIQRTVEGKRVVLKCYGYFNNHVVPVCDAFDRDGISLSESLVKQGWVLPNAKLGIATDKQQDRLDAAMEQAKQDQVGAWKPFHNMFRGLN